MSLFTFTEASKYALVILTLGGFSIQATMHLRPQGERASQGEKISGILWPHSSPNRTPGMKSKASRRGSWSATGEHVQALALAEPSSPVHQPTSPHNPRKS